MPEPPAAVRFAPSPTGRLHVGNVRAAVFNKLLALKTGGTFLLRLDDTDTERSTAEFAAAIEEDLAWLGLAHDRRVRQSDRLAAYAAAADRLRAAGHLYAAYETPEELERRRKRAVAQGRPPVYDRAALALSAGERLALEQAGRRPHWRLKLPEGLATWTDLIRGPVSIPFASLSDPVLLREDGRVLYTFASVVDDIDFGITHVMRGEDHVTNTAVQLALFAALGAPPPAFAHYALLVGAGGEQLSKRLGSLAIADLRADGIEPEAVVSLLARLGTSDPVVPRLSLADLAAEFAFDRIGRAPAHFDPAELTALNARLIHLLPYARVRGDLRAAGADLGEPFWLAVRDNITRVAEAASWVDVIRGPLAPGRVNPALTVRAADLLPDGPLTEESWAPWTKRLAEETGLRGRDLFQPLRLALTGRAHGPEMKKLIALIPRERILARLRGETA